MAKRLTMAGWIHASLTDKNKTDDGKTPCSLIALVIITAGGSATGFQPVYEYRFGGAQSTPEELAKMFQEMADNHIQDMPTGVYTFNLWAYYGTTVVERRYPFIINKAEDTGPALMTENPDERGSRAQGMRQGELVFQQMLRKQEHLDNFALRMIELQGRQIIEAREQADEARTMVFEVLQRLQLSNNDHQMKLAEYQRRTEMQNRLLKMVPPAVNTLTGANVFPQETEDTAIVETLTEAIGSKNLEQVLMFLGEKATPEFVALIKARMLKYEQKAEAEKQKLAALYPSVNPDPAADARGDSPLRLVAGGKKEGDDK